MSRHSIAARRPDLTVVVGWDNPLQTYFAHVSHEEADEDHDPVLLWLGGTQNEITTPDALVTPLAPYASLSEEMIRQLRADRAACGGHAPTALQRDMLDILRRQR